MGATYPRKEVKNMNDQEDYETLTSEKPLWQKEFEEDRELYDLMIWAN